MSILGNVRKSFESGGIVKIETDSPDHPKYQRAVWAIARQGWRVKKSVDGAYTIWEGTQVSPEDQKQVTTKRKQTKRRRKSYPELGSSLRVTVIGEDGKDGGFFLNLLDEKGKAWTAKIE